jgi:hypothetical protein
MGSSPDALNGRFFRTGNWLGKDLNLGDAGKGKRGVLLKKEEELDNHVVLKKVAVRLLGPEKLSQ